MNQDDYIKQLEETNRQLQEKLEASEKKHDDFLDKPVYIYMDGKSRSFDNLSFTDKNGAFEGEMRVVTNMRYIQKVERMYGDAGSDCYEQTWASDGRGGFMWVVTPSLNLNITQQQVIAKTRKLKAQWTASVAQDFMNMYNTDNEKELLEGVKEEVEKFTKPIKKPTPKQIKKYGKKHVK